MGSEAAVREALAYLTGLTKFGVVPTLERMHVMLPALDNPHTRYPVVHVAGTNGKGSTARLIAAALQAAGLVTGLFTSPHLVRYNERLMVQGLPISDEDLLSLVETAKPLAKRTARRVGHPTEFEMTTVMAFLHFARSQVDVAVMEVGMGGVWDSTNVVHPLLSVITAIGLDHMDKLGATIAGIAAEKAGIIKTARPVVVAPQNVDAERVIAAVARDRQAPVTWVREGQRDDGELGNSYYYVPRSWDLTGGLFDLEGPSGRWSGMRVGMLGSHQITNAAVAAVACQSLHQLGLPISEEKVRQAIGTTQWPGRLELLTDSPGLLLDGAHNAHAAQSLGRALGHLFPDRRKTLVLGTMAEKQVDDVLAALLPHASAVLCTAPASSRTPPLSPEQLAHRVDRVARRLGLDSIAIDVQESGWQAVEQALAAAGPTDVVCVCGSLYLVGEVRGAWERKHGTSGLQEETASSVP